MVGIVSSDDSCSLCSRSGDDIESCGTCEIPVCSDCSEEDWPDIFCSAECMSR